MDRFIVWLAGVGYATIFGFSFIITKGALDSLAPTELLFLRFTVAALALTLLRILGLLKLDYRRASWKHLALTCLFQPILYFLSETYGVRESASSIAGIVIGAIPVSVAVAGALMLGERLTVRQIVFLLLSVGGVALSVAFGTSGGALEASVRGILLLLGAVAAATFFNIYSRKTSKGLAPMETTFAMMWTGAIFFGLMSLILHLTGLESIPQAAQAAVVAPTGLLARAWGAAPSLAYLGLLSSVGAFFLINFTLSRLRASQSAVFTNLTTLVSVLAGVLFRGEHFGFAQALGALMIVVGVWGTNAQRSKDPA